MNGRLPRSRRLTIDGGLLPDTLNEGLIQTVVHGFYDKIRCDKLLGPIFGRAIPNDRWSNHLAKMCDFWSGLLLHTRRYSGRPLPPHLAIGKLGEEHFRRWLTLFNATVEEVCPPDVAPLFMDRALRIANSFRLAIAFDRSTDGLDITEIPREDLLQP